MILNLKSEAILGNLYLRWTCPTFSSLFLSLSHSHTHTHSLSLSLAFFLSTHLFVKTSMSLDKANDDQILFLLEKMWGWKEKEREAKILGRKRETERGTVMRLLEDKSLESNKFWAPIMLRLGFKFVLGSLSILHLQCLSSYQIKTPYLIPIAHYLTWLYAQFWS